MNKENFFYKNRKEIGRIAASTHSDVDVACIHFLKNKGLDVNDYRMELKEFLDYSKSYLLGKPGKSYKDLFHGEE